MFCWSRGWRKSRAVTRRRGASSRGRPRERMAPRRSQPRVPKRISRRETNAKSRRARGARGRAGGKRGGEGEHRGGGAGGDGRGRAPRCALSRETTSAAKVTWTARGWRRKHADRHRAAPTDQPVFAWRFSETCALYRAHTRARVFSRPAFATPTSARLRAAVVLRARVRRVLVVVAPDTRPIVPARRFEALHRRQLCTSPERRQFAAMTTLTLGFGAAVAPASFSAARASPRATDIAPSRWRDDARARLRNPGRTGGDPPCAPPSRHVFFRVFAASRDLPRDRAPPAEVAKSRRARSNSPALLSKIALRLRRPRPPSPTPFPSTIPPPVPSARGEALLGSALLLGATFAFPRPSAAASSDLYPRVRLPAGAPSRPRSSSAAPPPSPRPRPPSPPRHPPRRRSSPPPTPRRFDSSRNGSRRRYSRRWRFFCWRVARVACRA